MGSSLRYFLLAAALFAGGLLFACSSDDDSDDDGSDEPTVEQPADDSEDGDDGNGDDGDDFTDVSDELREFAEQFGITEVRVTYDFSGPGVGDSGFVSQMILYAKPPDRWRMDITSPEGDISMIFDGESTLLCASEGGEGRCLAAPLDDALGIPFFNIFTDPGEIDDLVKSALGVDVSRSSREIAGQDANCFSFSGGIDDTSGAGEYCFRDDGVLLLLRAEDVDGDEDFTIEATDVRDSVSDNDLEPPYEVLDLGDLIP